MSFLAALKVIPIFILWGWSLDPISHEEELWIAGVFGSSELACERKDAAKAFNEREVLREPHLPRNNPYDPHLGRYKEILFYYVEPYDLIDWENNQDG